MHHMLCCLSMGSLSYTLFLI
uniref:Uncharacterized protein n=1 Tax=Anguilla anguilla TaxID=7936 RepID=A0A0E9TW93_ANGAN